MLPAVKPLNLPPRYCYIVGPCSLPGWAAEEGLPEDTAAAAEAAAGAAALVPTALQADRPQSLRICVHAPDTGRGHRRLLRLRACGVSSAAGPGDTHIRSRRLHWRPPALQAARASPSAARPRGLPRVFKARWAGARSTRTVLLHTLSK